MKKIAFQSYLDCLYGGVQRRFFSNVVEIEVEEKQKPTPVRKSIKIPHDGGAFQQTFCERRAHCLNTELLVVAIMLLC